MDCRSSSSLQELPPEPAEVASSLSRSGHVSAQERQAALAAAKQRDMDLESRRDARRQVGALTLPKQTEIVLPGLTLL